MMTPGNAWVYDRHFSVELFQVSPDVTIFPSSPVVLFSGNVLNVLSALGVVIGTELIQINN
jgi:hypothetical protein